MASDDKTFVLTTEEAAEVLDIQADSLIRYRSINKGPAFCHVGGAVRYLSEDVEAYRDSIKGGSDSNRKDVMEAAAKHASPIEEAKDLLTNNEAAELLRIKPNTLQKWRSKEKGPPFHKIEGVIRYKKSDIDSYLRERRTVPEGDDDA